jgi:hypothetical protein
VLSSELQHCAAQKEPDVLFPCSGLKSKPTKKMAEVGDNLILLALLFCSEDGGYIFI